MGATPAETSVLVYCSSTSWGGLEMNSIRYAGWFQERGFAVKVACVNGSPAHEAALKAGLAVILVRRNGKTLPLKSARELAKELKTSSPDVVWFRDKRDMAVLAWTKRFSNSSFKLIYHQAMQLGVSKKDPLHTWRFKAIDRWIALLDFLAEQVKTWTSYPEDRIRIIPLGQEESRFDRPEITQDAARKELGLPADAFIIGNIGRFDMLKGQHLLIDAAYMLHQQGHKVHVLLVGEPTRNEGDQYFKRLQQLREEHELQDYVHIENFREDVLPAYRAMDVFVLGSEGETFGNVTVEAMLSGTCVVGTNSSGTPELLDFGKAGLLFDPGNTLDLTDELLKLVSNPEALNHLASAGRQRALLHYTKDKVLDSLQEVLLSRD